MLPEGRFFIRLSKGLCFFCDSGDGGRGLFSSTVVDMDGSGCWLAEEDRVA